MKRTLGFLAAAGLFAAAPALAQTDASEVTTEDMLTPAEGRPFQVTANAGIGTFLGQLSDFTGLGGVWGVSLNGNVMQGLGFELAYNGSRNPITDDRIPDGEAMWRNGVDAMAKVYVPMLTAVKPYGGVGLGTSFFNASSGAEGLYINDWVAEVPVAAGLEFNSKGGLTAGARAMYNFMIGEEWARNAFAGESPEGGLLTGQITVGGSF